MKKQLIKYFKSLGIEVYTNTKARGHQGFFLDGRIDISKNTKEERIIPILLHEFTHYIHQKLEPNMIKTGGSLEVLFNLDAKMQRCKNAKCHCEEKQIFDEAIQMNFFGFGLPSRPARRTPRNDINHSIVRPFDLSTEKNNFPFEEELLKVTKFVDTNSHMTKLNEHKAQIKQKIKVQEEIIKKYYPKFMRSKKFREFDKYIKKSKAKYLLRYDRVKFITPFLRKEEFYSINTIEQDFPDMPTAFCAYIRLKSAQRKQARISARINRLNKYYAKPTELFARLVEGLYIDEARVRALAPHSTQRFLELLNEGYYFELKNVFELLNNQNCQLTRQL